MFTIKAYHNPYLQVGQNRVQAVLTVNVNQSVSLTPAPLALAIALDHSGSMDGAKMRAARDGAIKVIQALDENITFMVVSFNERARVIVPPCDGTPKHKKQAVEAMQHIYATGGTCMSYALDTIVQHFGQDASRALKILFLTDGRNEGEQRRDLDRAIENCRRVQASISAWGIGTDWDEAELRHMAEATHGSADIIPTPQQVEAAFTAAFMEMRNTSITSARLRLWSPAGVKIHRFEQVYPNIVPLGLEPDSANPRYQVASLGSFAAGDGRDYLLDLDVPTYDPGQQFLMVRPSISYFAAGSSSELEEKSAQDGWVFVQWTEDASLAAQMEEHIAHYTHQEDLLRSLKEGQAYLAAGDYDKATRMLGQALEISERTGNDRITRLLSQLVMRDAKGTIQLNKQASEVARKTLAINSGRTSKLK
ncbi:MAG TPA: VWA domain-containing protein [Ktedonobacteraceae bacterium]|nr:VWA domain-containing protein [Ktedonobacteraceae bacterium]